MNSREFGGPGRLYLSVAGLLGLLLLQTVWLRNRKSGGKTAEELQEQLNAAFHNSKEARKDQEVANGGGGTTRISEEGEVGRNWKNHEEILEIV